MRLLVFTDARAQQTEPDVSFRACIARTASARHAFNSCFNVRKRREKRYDDDEHDGDGYAQVLQVPGNESSEQDTKKNRSLYLLL